MIFKSNDFTLLQCEGCDFVLKELNHEEVLTGKLSGFQYLGSKESLPRSADFLDTALSWFPKQELKIMDFGCSESKVPQILRTRGHKVIAIDTDTPDDPHPDRLVGNLEDFTFSPHTFNIIYSYKSFERIAEPKATLKKLFWYLEDNGLLVIHTNMKGANAIINNILEEDFQLPHKKCSFYNFSTFEMMIEQLNHEIIYRNPNMFIARK